MKKPTATSDDLPVLKEEDLKAAAERREKYALSRDIQAEENNEAIVRRLLKDKVASQKSKEQINSDGEEII